MTRLHRQIKFLQTIFQSDWEHKKYNIKQANRTQNFCLTNREMSEVLLHISPNLRKIFDSYKSRIIWIKSEQMFGTRIVSCKYVATNLAGVRYRKTLIIFDFNACTENINLWVPTDNTQLSQQMLINTLVNALALKHHRTKCHKICYISLSIQEEILVRTVLKINCIRTCFYPYLIPVNCSIESIFYVLHSSSSVSPFL